MINYEKLGRYEFIDYSINSDKFWTIKYIKPNEYEVEYGRNGQAAHSTLVINEKIASKRIKEKILKGYDHVPTSLDDVHKNEWIIYTKEHYEKMLPEKKIKDARRIKI